MCSLIFIFIYAIYSVVFIKVASEWKPYNGLWYYISEDNDKLTHNESEEMCQQLKGRLAAFSLWPDDYNKLANFTGTDRRWINGEPPRVIYMPNPDKYKYDDFNDVLNRPDPDEKYGYICDWQCHSFSVYPLASFLHIERDVHQRDMHEEDMHKDDVIRGVYDLVANDDRRQLYLKNDSTNTKIYQKHQGENNHTWCFSKSNYSEDYVCKSSTHFTPYNDPYRWEDIRTPGQRSLAVNFFCHDCEEYEVSVSLSLRNDNVTSTDNFYITHNDAELVTYINANYDGYLVYDSHKNQWCLNWQQFLNEYCFEYKIAPTVEHVVEHVSFDSRIRISLSCKTNTFPMEQSTATSMENETTRQLDAKETTITAMTSDAIRSDNKTAIYIAIACTIGSVVIIIIISLAVVCGRRRMMNKRKRDTEQNMGKHHIPKYKANIYSEDTQSTNYAEIKDSPIVVENKSGKANSDPLYEQAKGPTPENVYSEAEMVDLNNDDGNDGNDSETEFFNNDIYEGNVNMDRKNTEVPLPVPMKSPSGSDIEMYNNSLYEASGRTRSIGQSGSEMVKNMDNVDKHIELYDNDLYGS